MKFCKSLIGSDFYNCISKTKINLHERPQYINNLAASATSISKQRENISIL